MLAGWKWIVFGGEMSAELCHFGWWPNRELFDHISSDCIWTTFWGNFDEINHCSHFGIKSFLKLAPTWIGNFNKRHFMTQEKSRISVDRRDSHGMITTATRCWVHFSHCSYRSNEETFLCCFFFTMQCNHVDTISSRKWSSAWMQTRWWVK